MMIVSVHYTSQQKIFFFFGSVLKFRMILLILTLPDPNMTTKLPEKLTSFACEQFKFGETEYEKVTKLKTIEIGKMAIW
jgi:hypothetical protein